MPEETTETTEEETVETSQVSNADVKASPLFHKLTAQVKALTTEKEEREATEATAKAEVEEKRLKDAGLFDEAVAAHKAAMEVKDAKHTGELLKRDLETDLLKAGFGNAKFINGCVGDYDAEKDGTIAEYVKTLAEDEGNKPFLTTSDGETPPPPPPGKVTVSGGTQLTGDQLKALEKSADPKERKQARAYLLDHYQEHGKFPD